MEPRSSAQLGLEVVETIEAVDESLSRNGTPVRRRDARVPACGHGRTPSPRVTTALLRNVAPGEQAIDIGSDHQGAPRPMER